MGYYGYFRAPPEGNANPEPGCGFLPREGARAPGKPLTDKKKTPNPPPKPQPLEEERGKCTGQVRADLKNKIKP